MIRDAESFNDLSWGYRAARALQVAAGLELFTVLSEGPMTVEEVSRRCGTKPELTERLMIACAAMGLLEREGERFRNSQDGDRYLVRGREQFQGDIIRHSAEMWKFWDRLDAEIRLDGTVQADEKQAHRNFILGMHNLASAGRAEAFAESVDLSGRKQLMDVGGGPGSYSMALCRKNPGLRAVVFDLPETIEIAREVIARERMEDRVAVRAGDWNVDEFGENNDVVLFSNVLHGPGSQAEMKLAKAYRSMVPSGLLIVHDMVLNDEKTGPLTPAIFNVMIGAYSYAELFDLMRSAGFVDPKMVYASERYGNTIITAQKDGG